MPQVPAYEPNSVRTQPLAQVAQRGIDSDAFGGQAVAAGAKALGQLAEVTDQIAAQTEEANARQAAVEYNEFERVTLHGDGTDLNPGLYGLKGDAVGPARVKAEEAMRAKANELMGRATTNRARDMLSRVVSQQLSTTLEGVSRFTLSEAENFNKATKGAAKASHIESAAATALTDPEKFRFHVASALAATDDMLNDAGLGRDGNVTKMERLATTTAIHTKVMARLTEADPVRAQQYLAEHVDQIDTDTAAKLGERVAGKAATVQAMSSADEIRAKHPGDLAAQMRAAAELPPAQRAVVEPRLTNQHSIDLVVERDANNDLTHSAMEAIYLRNEDPAAMPEVVKQGLIRAGTYNDALAAYASKLKGEVPAKNGPAYMAAIINATYYPADFRNSRPGDWVGKVTPEEFTELVKMQGGALSGFAAQVQGDLGRVAGVLNNRLSVVKPELRGPALAQARAAAATMALGEIRQRHEDNIRITPEEIENIVGRVLQEDQAEPGKLFYESKAGMYWMKDSDAYGRRVRQIETAIERPLTAEERHRIIPTGLSRTAADPKAMFVPYSMIPKDALDRIKKAKPRADKGEIESIFNTAINRVN